MAALATREMGAGSSACASLADCAPTEVRPRLAEGALVEGRLRIRSLLGRGGMSEVYSAWDERARRRVAVKLMLVQVHPHAQFAIYAEARALLRARHENLVRLHGIGAVADQPFLELEELAPTSLADRVQSRGPLALGEFAALASQVGSALAALHAAGVAHRDVKADNVLYGPDGRAVLCDLGLAAQAEDTPLARARAVVGTPTYMAPEVLLGEARSLADCFAADQFAFAVLAHYALAGRFPFEAESPWAVAYAHLSLPPAALSQQREALPPALDAALLRALSKDPAERFPTLADFRDALLAAAGACDATRASRVQPCARPTRLAS